MSPWSLLLALVLGLIALATLLPTENIAGGAGFCLLCGPRGLADFVSNIVLFAPFGCVIALRGSSLRRALFAGALLACLIEALQIEMIPGRDATIGDVVANTVGAAAGWPVGRLRPWRNARDFGVRATVGLTALACSGVLFGLLLLSPVLPPPPYHLFWTPYYAEQEIYLGRVLSTRLGPLSWQQAGAPMEPGWRVRQLLQTEPLQARFLAGPPPYHIAPILTVQKGEVGEPGPAGVITEEQEIAFLGAGGVDFVYRFRSLADVLRLDDGDLRIPRVFERVQMGDTVDLAFSFDKRGYCIHVNGQTRCGAGPAVGDTWTVLLSPDLRVATRQRIAFAWLWLLFLPCGYVADRKAAALAAASVAVLCLLTAPIALGFASTPWVQLVAMVFGVSTGYWASGVYRHAALRRAASGR
jgi:hypothetical protein